MKMIVLASTILFSILAAGEEYQDCVLKGVAQLRTTTACDFSNLQMQVITSHRACIPVLMSMIQNHNSAESLKQSTSRIKQIKLDTDPAIEQAVQAEMTECQISGTVKISNGGQNIQITTVQFQKK